jgi:hypothetical protein
MSLLQVRTIVHGSSKSTKDRRYDSEGTFHFDKRVTKVESIRHVAGDGRSCSIQCMIRSLQLA